VVNSSNSSSKGSGRRETFSEDAWRTDRWACWSSFRRRRASAGSCRQGTTCLWTSYSRRPGCHRHAGTSSRSYRAVSDSRTLHGHNTSSPPANYPANYRTLLVQVEQSVRCMCVCMSGK